MDKTVAIIVPTYNEKGNVTPLVKRIDGALSGQDYQIVFIDDNSTDGTIEEANALSGKYPVNVIVRKDEKGLASAIVEGISRTESQIIGVIDADLQHPPETLPYLLEQVQNGSDVAVASRYVKGGGCEGWKFTRWQISKVATSFAHLFLPSARKVKDPLSGFFMLKRKVINNAELHPTGYKILLEILVEGKWQNLTEVPYTFKARGNGQSKLNAFQMLAYLKHLYSLMKRNGELSRLVKFVMVGASGVLVNIGILYILTEAAGLYYLASAAIGVEASIISNFTLDNYITFADKRLPGVKSFFSRLFKFNLIALAGLGINLLAVLFFTDGLGLYYIVSALLGIAAATSWNYLGNTWWTWK